MKLGNGGNLNNPKTTSYLFNDLDAANSGNSKLFDNLIFFKI
jgi:hypothetical protein